MKNIEERIYQAKLSLSMIKGDVFLTREANNQANNQFLEANNHLFGTVEANNPLKPAINQEKEFEATKSEEVIAGNEANNQKNIQNYPIEANNPLKPAINQEKGAGISKSKMIEKRGAFR